MPKRSFEELQIESDQVREEIYTLAKKQRKLAKALEIAPVTPQKKEPRVVFFADEAVLISRLSRPLYRKVIGDAGRRKFPDFGSLLSIRLEASSIRVTRFTSAEVVKVALQFEKGGLFEAVLFLNADESFPYVEWRLMPGFSDADASAFHSDRWKWALGKNHNDPSRAFFAVMIMKLDDGARDTTILDANDACKEIWDFIIKPEGFTEGQ